MANTTFNTELAGKTALVTGATSGIGRAIAFQLASQGAFVLIHGRDTARGVQVVEEIELSGGAARFLSADLTAEDEVLRLAADAGEIDILVNNAGTAWFGPTEELSTETFDRLFSANVRASFQLVAAFAPAMAARGTGSIISIGSIAGTIGLAGGAAYGATKASLTAATRAWAAEYGDRGVRVNAIAPGPVYTPAQPRESFDALGETTLLKRAAEPEEIAEVAGFLASPRASYITGATIAVDGGRTAV